MLAKLKQTFKALLQKRKIKADLFISLGGACRPAFYLQKYELRSFSSPYDWMMHYELKDIIKDFKENFTNFFKNYIELDSTKYGMRVVQDTNSKMIAMHDFPKDMSVKENYEKFIAQKRARFKKLQDAIKSAKHIVFISNRNEDTQNFKDFLHFMRSFRKARYTFINIRHNEKASEFSHKIVYKKWGGAQDNRI